MLSFTLEHMLDKVSGTYMAYLCRNNYAPTQNGKSIKVSRLVDHL